MPSSPSLSHPSRRKNSLWRCDMASIRLTEKQIRYLRGRGGVHTLYAALERFQSGELVTEKMRFGRKSSETVTVLHSQADQAFHAVSGSRNP